MTVDSFTIGNTYTFADREKKWRLLEIRIEHGERIHVFKRAGGHEIRELNETNAKQLANFDGTFI